MGVVCINKTNVVFDVLIVEVKNNRFDDKINKRIVAKLNRAESVALTYCGNLKKNNEEGKDDAERIQRRNRLAPNDDVLDI